MHEKKKGRRYGDVKGTWKFARGPTAAALRGSPRPLNAKHLVKGAPGLRPWQGGPLLTSAATDLGGQRSLSTDLGEQGSLPTDLGGQRSLPADLGG